jgi:hypothetical protein
MLVAFAFCVIQVFDVKLRATGEARQQMRFGWPHTLLLILIAAVLIGVFGGYLMSEPVVDMYKAGYCEQGVSSPFQVPPLSSPITWLRAFILIVVFFSTVAEAPRE